MKSQNTKFSMVKQLKSFGFAFNGLKILFKQEHNARIHLFVAGLVIVAGFAFQLSKAEWIAVIFSKGFVITTETINTVIENIADFLTIEKNHQIKVIKDLSAAAVLISSITALIIGVLIFLPKIIEMLKPI